MKHIRSITHLLVVIAMTTLMQMAQAAAITPDGRQELVALYVTMFGRAPTAVQLARLVAGANRPNLSAGRNDAVRRGNGFRLCGI